MGLGVVGAVCRWGLKGLCVVMPCADGGARRWGCTPMGLQACNGRGGNAKVVS